MTEAHARTTDPETSHEAARSVRDITAAQARILNLLKVHGPMTDGEIHAKMNGAFKISPSGARSRRSELVEAGLVVDSGAWGFTASGRRTIIWAAVER